jgi:cell division protein FtsL
LGNFAGQNSMAIQSVFVEVLIASGALTALLFIGFSEAAKALLDTEENTRAILQALRDSAQHRN